MVESGESFCLRWNDFGSNIKQGFSILRNEEEFFDVTIGCGSNQIKAHKVILSACSSFFRSLLKSIPHQHPFLYLRGIDFHQLQSIICFMYNGEVRVSHDELDQFLSIAEEFKLSGLKSEDSSSKSCSIPKPEPGIPTKLSPQIGVKRDSSTPMPIESKRTVSLEEKCPSDTMEISPHISHEDQILLYNSDQSESTESSSETKNDISEPLVENLESLNAELLKHVSPRDADNTYKCLKCSYNSIKRLNVMKHVEARHFVTNGFACEKCSRVFKTRESLSKHFVRIHKGDSNLT